MFSFPAFIIINGSFTCFIFRAAVQRLAHADPHRDTLSPQKVLCRDFCGRVLVHFVNRWGNCDRSGRTCACRANLHPDERCLAPSLWIITSHGNLIFSEKSTLRGFSCQSSIVSASNDIINNLPPTCPNVERLTFAGSEPFSDAASWQGEGRDLPQEENQNWFNYSFRFD